LRASRLLSRPSSFIRSTIDVRQLRLLAPGMPSSRASTSTTVMAGGGAAAAGAPAGAGAAGAAGAGAAFAEGKILERMLPKMLMLFAPSRLMAG